MKQINLLEESRIGVSPMTPESHVFEGQSHGFGLGTGTVAESWVDQAEVFWQKQIDKTG